MNVKNTTVVSSPKHPDRL